MRPSPTRRVATRRSLSSGPAPCPSASSPLLPRPPRTGHPAGRTPGPTDQRRQHQPAPDRVPADLRPHGGNRAAPDGDERRSPATTRASTTSPTNCDAPASSCGRRRSPTTIEVVAADRSRWRHRSTGSIKMTISAEAPAGGITAPLRVVPEDATTGWRRPTSPAGLRRCGRPDPSRRLHLRAEAPTPSRRSGRRRGLQQHAGPLANVTLARTGKDPDRRRQPGRRTTLAGQAGTRHGRPALPRSRRGPAERHRRDPHGPREQRGDGRRAPRQRLRAASTTTAADRPPCSTWR